MPDTLLADRIADGWSRILLLVQLTMVGLLCFLVPWTTDELTYLHAGIALRAELEFTPFETILHGPLPMLANQIAAVAGVPLEPLAEYKGWGRLGMLPFVFLTAWALWRFARSLGGARTGLAALALHVLNPLVLAHAPLMTPDLALAGTWTIACWSLWRWFELPGVGRAGLAGLSLGAALATKFVALWLVPAAALALLMAWRRAPVLWHAACVAGAAWVALWACYLFAPPGYEVVLREQPRGERDPHDPAAGVVSDGLRHLAAFPAVPALCSVLPAPFVRGIDFQQFYAEQGESKLGERRGGGFAGYYALALLAKLPLAWLLLLVLALRLRGPPWPRGAGLLLATAMLLLPLYLSFASAKQIGVRYLLPVLPLLALVAARPVAVLTTQRKPALLLLGLLAVLETASAWPRPLPWCNAAFRARAHLLFSDSTIAWPARYPALSPTLWLDPWVPDPDRAALQARHPAAAEVHEYSGPRLGAVLAHALVCGSDDPRDPGRVHHWLRALPVVDRDGEWLLFDADADTWRVAAGADQRRRCELAVALLGAGLRDEAAVLLAGNPDPDAGIARLLLDPALPAELQAEAWDRLGRGDHVLRLGDGAPRHLRAQALLAAKQYDQVVALLDGPAAAGAASAQERLLLAMAHAYALRVDDARAVLQPAPPAEADPERARWRSFAALLASQQQAALILRQRIGARRLR